METEANIYAYFSEVQPIFAVAKITFFFDSTKIRLYFNTLDWAFHYISLIIYEKQSIVLRKLFESRKTEEGYMPVKVASLLNTAKLEKTK